MTKKKEKAVVTGASGFYGHHLVNYLLEKTDWDVVAMCRENFVGNINRIYELESFQKNKERVKIVWHDLRSPINASVKKLITTDNNIDYIFHVAASSHVDRSIEDPLSFVYDNVVGTANLLEFAREIEGLQKFLYFSTDEVYGPSRGDGSKFTEEDKYNPRNPYSATKAAGEELCIAYENTYSLPIIISHCMNIMGKRQHPEKFIPLIISQALQNKKVRVHTDSSGKIPGKRKYIYADEVSNAVMFLLKQGVSGEKYNIEGQVELSNKEIVEYIAKKMDTKIKYELVPGKEDRPGHDFDYAISGEKMKKMGYKQEYDFWKSFDESIEWYQRNPKWLH